MNKVAARSSENHSNSAQNTVINSADICQKTRSINVGYNHGVVVEIVECITLLISGFVQPFERKIQALFNDFQVGM